MGEEEGFPVKLEIRAWGRQCRWWASREGLVMGAAGGWAEVEELIQEMALN